MLIHIATYGLHRSSNSITSHRTPPLSHLNNHCVPSNLATIPRNQSWCSRYSSLTSLSAMSSDAGAQPRFLTYRVQNIPYGTSKEALKSYFYVEDRDDIKIKSLCPAVDTPEGEEGDLTATIFFRPHEDPQREPRLAIDDIDIDKTFIGFTPLYVPPKEKGPIAAE
jgi:hypothetical protein